VSDKVLSQCPECEGTTFTDETINRGAFSKRLKKCSQCGTVHNPCDLMGNRYKVMRKIRLDHQQKAKIPA
jgi:uncharacterized Zn finger protein